MCIFVLTSFNCNSSKRVTADYRHTHHIVSDIDISIMNSEFIYKWQCRIIRFHVLIIDNI